MKGLRCQLKSVLHDKFCLMTFLLPIIAAIALNFVGLINFSALGEFHFGVLEGDLSSQTVAWLKRYGPVTAYATPEELTGAVTEPSTNLIGVKADGTGIKTILSGDELDLFRQTADTLPGLYGQRDAVRQADVQILSRPDVTAGLQDMFLAVTLIAALFMGCTFNAMNMISEKEDGVALINVVLPMTRGQYILQKIVVGFIFGFLSSVITVCICFRLSLKNAVIMLALILLSAFVAALAGLLIGRVSGGLMIGVVYIKIAMLLFMAVPVLHFLVDIRQPVLSVICYLVPSQAAFEGIMDLTTCGGETAVKDIFILLAHCAGWLLLDMVLFLRREKDV